MFVFNNYYTILLLFIYRVIFYSTSILPFLADEYTFFNIIVLLFQYKKTLILWMFPLFYLLPDIKPYNDE